MEAPGEVIVLGAVIGTAYGLLAAGLVFAFRISRVLNLAHGQVGVFAAIVLALLVAEWNLPWWLAFAWALVVGALVGGLLELAIVRRLRNAPPLMSLVATLGAGQGLLYLGLTLARELPPGTGFPQPEGIGQTELGYLVLSPAYQVLAVLGPLAVGVLAFVLARTHIGVAMRAAAANPEAARMLGVPAARLSTAAWALAGVLATVTAALLLPNGATAGTEALGPGMLLRALAPAVIAGLASLPLALVAGTGVGVIEQLVLWNGGTAGIADVVLLGITIAALGLRPALRGRLVPPGSWAAFARWRPLPPAARRVPFVRLAGTVIAGILVAGAGTVPLWVHADTEVVLTQVGCLALVAVSVWIVSGLTGQLSLGQVAIAGMGAAAAAQVESPAAGVVAGVAAGALVGGAVGWVARHGRPLDLAVATVGLAYVADVWLLRQDWALGSGAELDKVAGFDTPAGSYLIVLAVLVAVTVATSGLARGNLGRSMRAVRDNEPTARSFGLAPVRLRLVATTLAGAIAGLSGVLLAQSSFVISAASFPARMSVDAAAAAVLGGLAIAAGPIAGALWILMLPLLVDLPSAALAASALGWLILILYVPGGLAGIAEPLRTPWTAWLLRVAGQDPALAERAPPPRIALAAERSPPPARPAAVSADDAVALELQDVTIAYGGLRALDGVRLTVAAGETVGLVGPNGAGKTTLLDVAGGHAKPARGRVRLLGRDVTRWTAERRARLGLGRTFQQALLFPTLNVEETVLLAAGRQARAQAAARRAAELVAGFGLEPYAELRTRELSTGMRRVLELACLVALEPRVLLLDEPSAGLAAAERPSLAGLLETVRGSTAAAILIVEHDLGLVERLADRIAVLERGRLVSEPQPGPPPRTPVAGEARA